MESPRTDETERQARATEIFLRPTLWKVFVSSEMRSGTLSQERRLAAEAIEDTGLARAWFWERDAVAGPYSSERECLGQAKTSDILVVLLAEKISTIVRKEYEAARDAGATCFIFVKENVVLEPDTKEFIDQHRSIDQITVKFSDLEELRVEIENAIRTYAIRAGRQKLFESRFQRSALAPFVDTDLPTIQVANPTPAY